MTRTKKKYKKTCPRNAELKKCEKHPTVANLEELESAAVLEKVHSKSFDEGGRERKETHRMKENSQNNPQQAAVAEPPFCLVLNINI